MKSTYLLALALLAQFGAFSQKQYLLVGTYTDNSTSKGIYVFEFNPKTGAVSARGNVEAGNPSYLAISKDGKYVYSVNESEHGKISSFSFDKKNGAMKPINFEKNNGSAPCYVELDHTGKWLFCGNYSSGDLTLHAINRNGSIGPMKQLIKHSGHGPDKNRQTSPHVHCTYISKDNRFLYVPDLGIDKVMIYPFNDKKGVLDEDKKFFAQVQPGGGPRHITFSANGKFAYLVEELSGSVDVFRQTSGRLESIQKINKLPAGETPSGADIHLSPDGRFLYVSQRSNSTIQIFRVNAANGMIDYVDAAPSGGTFPRNFTIHPSGDFLLTANQKSDDIVIYKRDKITGLLTQTGRIAVGKPVCLKWVK